MVHLAVHGRVPSGALLHELSEYASVVGFLPLLGYMVEDALALRLASPVGNDLALVGVNVLLRDSVALQLALVQRVQVLHTVASQLRDRRDRLGQRATLAHNELIFTNIDSLFLAYLIEVLGTQHSNGHRAIVLLVEVCFYQGALYAERGRSIEVLLAETADALVHAALILGVFDAKVHVSFTFEAAKVHIIYDLAIYYLQFICRQPSFSLFLIC